MNKLETDAGSSVRWAKAAARAEGLTDLGIGSAVRRYYLVPFPVIVLISFAAVFVIVSLWSPRQRSVLGTGLTLGMMLAGLASSTAGFVYGSKKIGPKVQPRRIGVTIGLTADEVKGVRRQVLGKEPVDADLTVLKGAAVQLREGLARQLVTIPPLMLSLWGQALNTGLTTVLDVLMLVGLLGMLVVLGFTVREFQRTGSFLIAASGSASVDWA